LENKALSEKHSEPSETAKTRNGGQPFFGNKHTNKKGPARTAKAAMPGIPKKQSCKSLYAVTVDGDAHDVLTSSLKKHKFHNCLATIVLYLCVT